MSYISYLIYPYSALEVDKTKLIQLQRRYEELLDKYQNNTFRLLDQLTYSCDEIFWYCKIGQTKVDCCKKLYITHLYINKQKCFSNQGPTIYMPATEEAFAILSAMYDPPKERKLDWNISGHSAYFAYGWSIVIIDNKTDLFIDGPKHAYLLGTNIFHT